MSEVNIQELISPQAHQFYEEHSSSAIDMLMLKYGRNPLIKKRIEQLESRQKIQKKLPTWHANKQVVFPPKLNLEQASSEQTALFKAALLTYQTSVDLTAGTAVDSWAFAKQAAQHVLVEPSKTLCHLATHNFNALGLANTQVQCATAEAFLDKTTQPFDLIYIDPSRRATGGKKVIRLENYSPNVIALQNKLLARGTTVMIKVSPMVDLHYLQEIFGRHLHQIHVVAVHNEVKEILIILQKTAAEFTIVATNLMANEPQTIAFLPAEINATQSRAQSLEAFIYEPNAAVLKTGFFNSLCQRFNIKKLDTHSHLYTSAQHITEFPGGCYSVVEQSAPFKLKTTISSASIISRNFPQKPDAIRKRLNMKHGNKHRIFATTLNGKKCFILGQPVTN